MSEAGGAVRRRKRSWPLTLLLLAVFAAGVWLVLWGRHANPPAPAPMPSAMFSYAPSKVPSVAAPVSSGEAPANPDDGAVEPTGDPDAYLNGDKQPVSVKTMKPNRLYIPAQGVYASIEYEPRPKPGTVYTPEKPWRVAVDLVAAPIAAKEGATLINGHVNWSGVRGALWNLSYFPPGTAMYLADDKGVVSKWVLSANGVHPKDRDMPADLWRLDGPRTVTLVTCGGPVVGGHYTDNVTATFVPAR